MPRETHNTSITTTASSTASSTAPITSTATAAATETATITITTNPSHDGSDNEQAPPFSMPTSYDAYDDARIRRSTMSTFRNASSNVSIAMEPSNFDVFRGHSIIPAPQIPMDSTPIAPSTSAPLPGVASILVERRRPKAGILRLDINKPRRSSGGSVEFRAQPEWLGENPCSPTRIISPNQLSVTWAETCDINESHLKFKPKEECIEDAELQVTSNDRTNAPEEHQTNDLSSPVELGDCELPSPQYLTDDYNSNINNNWNNSNSSQEQAKEDEDDEEDYSVSVSAIMQRRASIRGYRNKRGSRCSRRASSPMDHVFDSMEARRRSSVYTSSSDEGTNQESTQEQIFENIRLHKEVIQSVKLQPWPIRKKLKLVRQAKTYVARHEGALQERFAMSRSTKDLFARFKILMAARWRHWKRETSSFLTVLIPWELRIKEIESHFGSGVASYFTFLRWLMWVNIMIAIPLVAFVIGPEYFATKHDETDPRKKMSDHEYEVAGNLFTIWEFEGYLKYSPMFYGYYSSVSGASSLGYKLPLAYFLTAVVVYIYSFVATLRKMAENSRNSKLSSKDDECTFSWKLFTGWDFMIGHAETAHNRIASVVVGFKEALLEEAEKKKDKRNWRIIMQRILVNILVMGLLAASGYTVVLLVNKSEELARQDNWLSRNAVNVTMTLISFFLPMIFEALGLFENWHPRQQLRLQLARIMILNMLNLYSLMFSFIYKINSKERPLQDLKIKNETATSEMERLTMLIQTLSTTLSYEIPNFIATSTTPIVVTDDNIARISSSTTDENWSSKTTNDIIFTTTATTLLSATFNRLKCYNITVKCSKPNRVTKMSTLATTLLFMNLTTTMWPLTTEPISSTINTTTSDSLMNSSVLSTVDTTINFNSNTDDPILSTMSTQNTTMTGKFLSTLTPNDDYNKISTSTLETYTNTAEDISTTTQLPTSTTTVTTPVGASFFDFYDYFAGFPIDLDKDTIVENNEIDPNETKRIKRPTKESSKQSQHVKLLKKQNTKNAVAKGLSSYRRNIDKHASTAQYPQFSSTLFPFAYASLPTKMSTAMLNNFPRRASAVTTSPTKRYFMNDTTTKQYDTKIMSETTQATGNSALQSDVSTDRANIDVYFSKTTDTTTITTTTTSINAASTTKNTRNNNNNNNNNSNDNNNNNEEITTIQSELWVPNADLPEVVAYFTNSTTTALPLHTIISNPTVQPITTSAPTTEVITERSNTLSSESSTPYFIDDNEVEDIGEPSYYDMHEINDGHFEPCVRTICEEIIPTELSTSRTTELDGTTDIAILPALTPLERNQLRLNQVKALLSEVQKNLTNMCWETSLGQELSKVIVFDGLMGIAAPLCIDFLRALFVRYVNQHWCWDMEKTFPQYGDFKIAENILTLIYNQGQVWMGIFFSPGLVLINLAKLVIMMYFRSWIVLTCNVPHEVVFKASKSNNFYLTLLLTMLFLCVLPVGYAIVWLRPSWHCGPFSDYNRIAEFITNTTRNALPKELHEPLDYLTSASTVIPLLLLLVLIIYYLISLTGALREANQDLRTQLQKEREEERRKMFKVPEMKPIEPPAATLTSRWRKVLEASSPVTPTQPPNFETEEYKNQARKELISRIMKKALRKGSATSDEDSVVRQGRDDDDTDTEHHDSLPHDEEGKERIFSISKLQSIRRIRKPSLVDIVQIAKSERERERKASMTAAAAVAAAASTGTGAVSATAGMAAHKEAHPKSRFKIDKHERKDKMGREKNDDKTKEQKSTTFENEHDPEVNSRIVNERRESLMRRKREDDELKGKEQQENISIKTPQNTDDRMAKYPSSTEQENPSWTKTSQSQPLSTRQLPRTQSQPPLQRSNTVAKKREWKSSFRLINEKKSSQGTERPAAQRSSTQEGGKFRFIRQRIRSSAEANSNEPEVFKFDEKSSDKCNIGKLGQPVEIPSISGTEHLRAEARSSKSIGEHVTPPHTPSLLKYTNSVKLANLSRQGRKKIGSFIHLMREAARKFEIEQLQQQANAEKATSEPTTPISPSTLSATPTSIVPSTSKTTDNLEKSSSIIDIAKDTASSPIDIPSSSTAAESSALSETISTKKKLGRPEDYEELDTAGPIIFSQRSLSLRRSTANEHPTTQRQDSQASVWSSDQIPTITISTTGSDECVANADAPSENTPTPSTIQEPSTPSHVIVTAPTSPTLPSIPPPISSSQSVSPDPKVNIVKITIEHEKK